MRLPLDSTLIPFGIFIFQTCGSPEYPSRRARPCEQQECQRFTAPFHPLYSPRLTLASNNNREIKTGHFTAGCLNPPGLWVCFNVLTLDQGRSFPWKDNCCPVLKWTGWHLLPSPAGKSGWEQPLLPLRSGWEARAPGMCSVPLSLQYHWERSFCPAEWWNGAPWELQVCNQNSKETGTPAQGRNGRSQRLGCWLDVRLASQRIYTHSDIFLLLDKAFWLVVVVAVVVVVLCVSSPPCHACLLCLQQEPCHVESWTQPSTFVLHSWSYLMISWNQSLMSFSLGFSLDPSPGVLAEF